MARDDETQFLLAEYGTLREEILHDLNRMGQWRLAMLPFAGTLYAFAIQFKHSYVPLIGVAMLVIMADYLRAQLLGILRKAAYIAIFIESQTRCLPWETLGISDRLASGKKPTRVQLAWAMVYFGTLGILGLAISLVLSWREPGKRAYLLTILSALGLVALLLVSYRYITCLEKQREFVDAFRAEQKALQRKDHNSAQDSTGEEYLSE